MKKYLLYLYALVSISFTGCKSMKVVDLFDNALSSHDSIALFTGDPGLKVKFINTDSMQYQIKPRFYKLKNTIYHLSPGYHTFKIETSGNLKCGDYYENRFLFFTPPYIAFTALQGHKYHLFFDFYSIDRSFVRIEDVSNKPLKYFQLDTIQFKKLLLSYSPSKIWKFTNDNNNIQLGKFQNKIGFKDSKQIARNEFLPIDVSQAVETGIRAELQNLGFCIGESNIEIGGKIINYGKKYMELSFNIIKSKSKRIVFEDTYFSSNNLTNSIGSKDNYVRTLRDCIIKFVGFPEESNPIKKLLLYCTKNDLNTLTFDSLTFFSGPLRSANKIYNSKFHWLISDSLRYHYPYWFKISRDTVIIGYTDCFVSYFYHFDNPQSPINFRLLNENDTINEWTKFYLASLAGPFPLSGVVTQVNKMVLDNPLSVYNDPYGVGWLFKMKISDKSELKKLLSSKKFEKFIRKKVLID